MAHEQKTKNVGGGSLLIAWQLNNKRVLIVGGGEVASQRVESILATDASITLISPSEGVHPRTKRFIDTQKEIFVYHDRAFEATDLDGMDMVLTALDDNELSRRIVEQCRERRIPVNAADIPDLCDFYFGAQIRDGPLQVMISTNGNGPRMASLIRTRLQRGLSGLEGEAITKIGVLRNKLKERAPGIGGKAGKERMKWMSALCNEWEMEEFTVLDETSMERLLDEGWERDRRVPRFKELGLTQPLSKSVKPAAPAYSASLLSSVAFVAGVITATLFFTFRKKA